MQFVANPAADGALVGSNTFSVVEGTGYQLRFGARASAMDVLSTIVRRASDPWDDVGLVTSAPVKTTKGDFVFVFVATKSATARVDFGFSQSATQFSVDDVSLREVTVSRNDTADDARIVVNDTATQSAVDLAGAQYCDVDGAVVGGQVTLAPYSSKILLSCFCNNDYQCNNRETATSCPNDCQ